MQALLDAHLCTYNAIFSATARLIMLEGQLQGQHAAGANASQQQQAAGGSASQQQHEGEQAGSSADVQGHQDHLLPAIQWIAAVSQYIPSLERTAALRDCRPCCLCGGPVVQFPEEEEGSEVQALPAAERWLSHAAALVGPGRLSWEHEHPRRDLRHAAAERTAALAAAREAAAAARLKAQQGSGPHYMSWEEAGGENEWGDWGYRDVGYGLRCHLTNSGFLRGDMVGFAAAFQGRLGP